MSRVGRRDDFRSGLVRGPGLDHGHGQSLGLCGMIYGGRMTFLGCPISVSGGRLSRATCCLDSVCGDGKEDWDVLKTKHTGGDQNFIIDRQSWNFEISRTALNKHQILRFSDMTFD